jgi:RNA polymerase sigma-70 factor (ECF subfamily)
MSTTEFNQMLVSNTDFLKPFAATLTRDTEAAKDLLQETMYRALANKDKYFTGTNIKAWLYTIMRNIFINNYRKASKQTRVFDQSPNEFLLNSIPSNQDTEAISAISHKQVNGMIRTLPEIFREPFVLYFEGYKYNEIAEILHEPLGTIKSRIHFARKLLKNQIERN